MPTPIDSLEFCYVGGQDVRNSYQFIPGVCALPLAEDPPTDPAELVGYSPVVNLVLHAPYRIRRVWYDAQKDHAPAVIPTPADAGKFVFLSGSVGVRATLNQTFVMFDWATSCQYDFVENCVSRPEDGLVLGSMPWFWQSSVEAGSVYPPTSPGIGAISQAGEEAKVGYTMSLSIDFTNPGGYVYNIPSYLPGVFFSDNLVNGGTV